MPWEFKREETQFEVLPEGSYRIRVKRVDKAQSQSGNDMLSFQFEVSGHNQILYHYIVFLQDRPEITNRMLTQFFDSFKGIQEGDLNIMNWFGQMGACVVKHDEYNGRKTAKISYFINASRQDELPPWVEPKNAEPKTSPTDGFATASDDNLPFE